MTISLPVVATFEDLDAALTGRVVTPAAADWDTARAAWNLAVDQRPVAVALPEDVDDVVAVVRFARDNGLRVAPQATGHNAAPMGALDDTILLRMSQFRAVQVDPVRRVARVGAGATWGDVVAPVSAHGLAVLAGSSHDVGVAGYTLGGGVSFLGRRYGLGANHVVGLDVVTADGEARHVDANHDPDLFWALRGGGGGYAVVTALELELFPVTEVYAGMMLWPLERAAEVLMAWRAWTDTVPDTVTSVGRIVNVPPLPDIPEPLRGRAFVLVEVIAMEEDGDALVAPLRALGPGLDTCGVIPVADLLHLHMDPPGPVPGHGDGQLLADLPAAAVDALVTAAGAGSGSPLLSVEVRHMGGAFAVAPPGAGAVGSFAGRFLSFAVGMAPDPETAAVTHTYVDRVMSALRPYAAATTYQNFAESRRAPGELFPPATLARLREVKAAYDPANLLRANHPIV